LERVGHTGKIIMGSRHGVMPAVCDAMAIQIFEKKPVPAIHSPKKASDVVPAYRTETFLGRSVEYQDYSHSDTKPSTGEFISGVGLSTNRTVRVKNASGGGAIPGVTGTLDYTLLCLNPPKTAEDTANKPLLLTVGPNGSVDDASQIARGFHLRHLQPSTVPRPLKTKDIVERFFSEVSRLSPTPMSLSEFLDYLHNSTPLEYISEQIASAETGRAKPWQLVFSAFAPVLRKVWAELDDEQRREYWRDYNWLYMNYTGCFPLVNARCIRDMMLSGRLTVVRDLEPIEPSKGAGGGYTLKGREGQHQVSLLFNATGYTGTAHDVPVLAGLLSTGDVAAHPFGGVQMDAETLQLMNASGKKTEGLYAVGELSKGQWLAAGNITLAADQAGRVAGAVAEKLRRTN